ncbi:9034_t:CDS:2, partial [Entrophospora sp. SA101]
PSKPTITYLKDILWNEPEALEKLDNYANNPQVNVLYVAKKNDDNKSYSYALLQEITHHPDHVALIAIIKHVSTLDPTISIQSQIQLINIPDPESNSMNMCEALQSYIHLAVGPYFEAYVNEKGIDVETNVVLNIHPVIQRAIEKCNQESKHITIDAIEPQLLYDHNFLNSLQSGLDLWAKEIKKVINLSHNISSGNAISEVYFWVDVVRNERKHIAIDISPAHRKLQERVNLIREFRKQHEYLHDGLEPSSQSNITSRESKPLHVDGQNIVFCKGLKLLDFPSCLNYTNIVLTIKIF